MQRWDIKILIHTSTTPHKERKNVHARARACVQLPIDKQVFFFFLFFLRLESLLGGVRIKGKRDEGKIVC